MQDSASATAPARYPAEIPLPDGSVPESIAIGEGAFAYVSSLSTGTVFRVDLSTGSHEIFLPATGTTTAGLKLDWQDRLYVCGGVDGSLSVVDTSDRSVLARYQLGSGQTFINDLVLTPDAAWITDSFTPVLYKLPFGDRGTLPSEDGIVRLPISGDFDYQYGDTFSENFNANGIVRTPDKTALLVVQTNTGKLFRIDPETGRATLVDLGGDDVMRGDGMHLEGQTLYVVQNMANTVSVIELNATGLAGKIIERWTSPRFDTPTSIDRFGDRFYLSNARFTTPSPETAEFWLTSITR